MAIEAVYSFGYPGLAVLVALTNLPLPIPSEVALPLARFLVGRGRLSFLLVLLASTTGAVLGALVPYALGRQLGEERLRRFVKPFGRFVFIKEVDLDKASEWFVRHGVEAVLFARLALAWAPSSWCPPGSSGCRS